MKPYYKITNCLEYLERSAQRFPDKIAFADEREAVSFAQLAQDAMRVGSARSSLSMASPKRLT